MTFKKDTFEQLIELARIDYRSVISFACMIFTKLSDENYRSFIVEIERQRLQRKGLKK